MKAMAMHRACIHVLGRRCGMYLLYRCAGDLHLSEMQGGAQPLPVELL